MTFSWHSQTLPLTIEIANKDDIVRKVVDSFKQPKIRISIRAVNDTQSEVLVVRKVNVDNQGFVIGYDIEINVTVFFVNNWGMFYEEGNSTSGTSRTIFLS